METELNKHRAPPMVRTLIEFSKSAVEAGGQPGKTTLIFAKKVVVETTKQQLKAFLFGLGTMLGTATMYHTGVLLKTTGTAVVMVATHTGLNVHFRMTNSILSKCSLS